MRRCIGRASVLCGAVSVVDSFYSYLPACTAGHRSAFVLQQPHHFLTCRKKNRGRWGAIKCGLALSSPGSNEKEKDAGQTPLFPELANPEPPQQSSTYDEAADALQHLRRGRPSTAGASGERALSASDEIRNAMASGGLEGAARAIQKVMGKGGDWYDGEVDDNVSEFSGDEVVIRGQDTGRAVDRKEGGESPLTNLDFLLGKLDDNNNEDQ